MLKRVLSVGLIFLGTVFLFGCATSGTGEYQSEPSGQTAGATSGSSTDVSGPWNVVSVGPRINNNSQIFYLTQKGNSIEGSTISGGTITGTIERASIRMRRGAGSGGPIIYTGTVDGQNMSGEWRTSDNRHRGSWLATQK